MKGYKKLAPIVLIVCMLGSFYMLYSTKAETANSYEKYVETARDYAKQGIAVDATVNYANALAIQDTLDLRMEVGEFYLKMKDIGSAIGWGEQIIDTYPEEPEGYAFLMKICKENADYNRCFALYEVASKRKIVSKDIEKIMKSMEYAYYLEQGFEDVGIYSNGYCPVQYEGKWGFVNEKGKKAVPYRYESVGAFMSEVAPVKTFEGECYFIDGEGNKKIVVQNVDNITELGPIASDVFAVKNGEKWNFYTKEYKQLDGTFNSVSTMGNQIAAVENDGYWTLINNEGKKVGKSKYIDVIQDDKGIVCRNEVLFASEDGYYHLVDKSGKKISKEKFEDAKLFMDDTYAPVKQDGEWHFIDVSGKDVFPKQKFEDARSFSNGYAAVKKAGRWGFIDQKGNLVIDCIFEDAKDFNTSGCVFVKQEEMWQLLRLYKVNYAK